jgi:hypothetical protein
VAKTPETTTQYERTARSAPVTDRGNGGEVIGLERMLHANQATESQKGVRLHHFPAVFSGRRILTNNNRFIFN